MKKPPKEPRAQKASLLHVLRPYTGWIVLLLILTIVSNGLNLWVPLIIARGVDAYAAQTLDLPFILWEFGLISFGILLLLSGMGILQSQISERVARDLRQQVAYKISRQTYSYIQKVSTARLLTNLTADIDSIKTFVSMAIVAIVSSILIIIGGSTLLLLTNWGLALAVLTIIPLIGFTFFFIFGKVRVLFLEAREVIDWLNKVINESVLGAILIRVLHGEQQERSKFYEANEQAQTIGFKILKMFATMIPITNFIANCASIILVVFGGWLVVGGSMTLGELSAFNSYVMLLIFPIFSLGFMSTFIAQAQASYERVFEVLSAPEMKEGGTRKAHLRGDVEVRNVTLEFEERKTLQDVSFVARAGTRTAIIGPTAAGKTQLIQLMTGLTEPSTGSILYDEQRIDEYDQDNLHDQVSFVFQDSVIFNTTLRENIAFKKNTDEAAIQKAITTAELSDFIDGLEHGLETVVSERGTSLSGGQKQRIMLARALALNPRVLLLDDFTARVDTQTEQRILENLQKNYPKLTLISVTQKIASVIDYDQIILLMEGEIIDKGTHEQLLGRCPEYVQIYTSQRSTNTYEVRT